MKTVIPHYYRKFKCIASECRHNCCKEGWEIDIDDAHVDLYKKLSINDQDGYSDVIHEGILIPAAKERKNGAVPHIVLNADGICPFLNESGLCSLILKYGEGSICDICTDHPRFRNYFKDWLELGIGMCCEEACRVILEDDDPGYEDLKTGNKETGKYEQTALREKCMALEKFPLDYSSWVDYFLKLERLENEWSEMLLKFREMVKDQSEESVPSKWEQMFDNLREYFLYRHGIETGAGFASFSVRFIRKIAFAFQLEAKPDGYEILKDICRLYSSEIEYSEDNRSAIIRKLESIGYR